MATPSSKELQESLDQAFDLVEQAFDGPETEFAADDMALTADGQAEFDDAGGAPPREPVRGSGLPLYLGVLLILVGFLLAAAPMTGALPAGVLLQLSALGVTPALPFVGGILLAALAWAQAANVRRSSEALSDMMSRELGNIRADVERMSAEARHLNPAARIDDKIGAIERSQSKQEGMVANLTKALRMHNKPLVDLVGMATDHAKSLQESDRSLLAIKLDLEAIEKAVSEIVTSSEKKWEGMFARLHGSENELEASLAKNREMLVERLEPQITEGVRRLGGDVEAHCELLRETLEKTIKEIDAQTRGELQALARRIEGIAAAPRAAAATSTAAVGSAAPASRPAAPAPRAPSEPAAEPAGAAGQGGVMSAIERLKRLRGS